MRNFVIINGVNSNTINGLGINELPPITKPEMRNIREEIDGRDGDIITNLGYSAYDKTITIGLFGTGYDINNIVAFFNGEGTIVFSNEPDKYYNFKILNQIDYESLQKFKTASITFHCQPFKYPLSETPLEIEYDYIEQEGETLTLNNTGNALMELNLKGNTSQSETPTPTSPIPVSVVSGDNDVVVCGKNLLGLTDGTYTDNGITAVVSNGTITLNGTATANSFVAFYLLSSITISNGTITISTNNTETGGDSATEMRVIDTGGGYNACKFNVIDNKATFTGITKTYNRIQIRTSSGVIYNNLVLKPQLELGSTKTSYEPYKSQTYEVDLPVENIANSSDNPFIFTANTDKTKTLGQVNLVAGITYYYSYTIDNATSSSTRNTPFLRINGTNKYENTQTNYNATPGRKVWTYNCQTTGTYDFGYWCHTPNVNLSVSDFMISTNPSKSYTPYGTTPIELCKIGDYQDYFTKNSEGQWCKYNAIGKGVLNGSENWALNQQSGSSYKYWLNGFAFDNMITGDNTYLVGRTLCDYFHYKNLSNSDLGSYTIHHINTINWVLINSDITSVADFKTWLGTHNTTIYYQLETPYLSLIEDNNLIEQLDNLENAMSYEGTTNIGQVNNDKPFIISAKALEDGTNEVVVNNIGNVYSKPLIALEGSGNVDIYLDNTQILKANVEDKMNIDIAQLEAYNPDTMTLLNRQVIGNYNSMTLQPGNNTIRIDGALDKATITNYTRYL